VVRARDRVRGWLSRLEGSPRARFGAVAWFLAALTVVLPPFVVVGPWLTDTSTFGFHDWDVQTSHRFLAVQALLKYGELPGWNPYACGGFPAWSYVESGTIVVSPWLPFYLLADIRFAIRVEVLGMALFGSLGTYLAASRFTESRGARAVVVALFAVNGRWALQAAAGHTWHLAYAIMPWALWAFERARGPEGRGRDVLALGGCFALLVYAGGIYPLPHTVLFLGLWAAALVVVERSLRPGLILAAGGALGIGLAAPKLLPMLATFERAPRLIESTESLSLGAFVTLLTSREQAFYDRPADVDPYGWHEWGMYVSLPGAALLALGVLLVRGKREAALTLIGVLFVVLGFGAFHPSAPWTLLHEHAPVFRSQHVPSRFLYPAVLVLGLVVASGLGRLTDRISRRVMAADAIVASVALALALDVASVAKLPMKEAMWMVAPPDIPESRPFRHAKKPPFHYVRRDWAGPMYLAMLGNTGVLDCYGTPPFEERGAISHKDRRYRGEVFFEQAELGRASLVGWTPGSAEIEVEGVTEDARLVYNMNFDPGWQATVDGLPEPVASSGHRVSLRVPAGARRVRLAYTPPRLWVGLAVFAITLAAIAAYAVRRRRAA
jgi:hypothetical protein